MDPTAKNFVFAGLIYFFISACLGLLMVFYDMDQPQLIFAHSHLNLLGWVSMMIYGVGYHILPRFSGNPIAYPKLMQMHFWVANISLLGLVSLWGYSTLLAGLFAVLQVCAIGMFVLNMFMSMRPTPTEG